MGIKARRWLVGGALALGASLAAGCYQTPVDTSNYVRGPAPLRMPSPAEECNCDCYEDSLTGGQIFTMYCSYCHNAPSLAERPFSQFRNVAAHMRVRANLTGKEYAKLMQFLRRWNDIPPPTPPPAPSPSRLIFSQPISELRPAEPKPEENMPAEPIPAPPKPGAAPPPKPAGDEPKKEPPPQ
jgi:hypothetical protein